MIKEMKEKSVMMEVIPITLMKKNIMRLTMKIRTDLIILRKNLRRL